MKNCFVVLCSVLVMAALSGPAMATPMDSILTWETYDTFSGPSLNTALWYSGGNGTLSTGATGLTLVPSAPSGGGDNWVGVRAVPPVDMAFFAIQVQFSINSSETAAGSGGGVVLGIYLESYDYNASASTNWVMLNNFDVGGTPYSGTFFVAGDLPFQSTSVTEGYLGLVYSEGEITSYYKDDTGWHQLGSPVSTEGWALPLWFLIDADIVNSGFLRAVVPEVQYSLTAPIPLPHSLLLFAPCLAGLAAFRMRFRK